MIQRILKSIQTRLKIISRYWRPWGYNADAYWQDRHSQYQMGLKGVGEKGLSEDENRAVYDLAAVTFRALLDDLNIDLGRAHVLDVGCGTGFYADIVFREGCVKYLGLDVADVLLPQLREQYPAYQFEQMDITATAPVGQFDLILMIDVTQHITQKVRFEAAMRHLASVLKPGGRIILTSWLDSDARNTFYERSRDLDDYRKCFDGFEFTQPVEFRDKYLFAVQDPRQA